MRAFDSIDGLLSGLGQHVRRATMVEMATRCLTAALGLLGLSLILAELGLVRTGGVVLLLSIIGSIAAWFWLVRRRVIAFRERYGLAAARLAESLAPDLGTAPSSAVDLARQMHDRDTGFSVDLASAHLERTARALDGANLEGRFGRRRAGSRRWGIVALLASVVWAVVLAGALDSGRTRLATLILDPGTARISEVPLAGDIRITYRYPAYTGNEVRVVEGGDGSISAVVGTEVEITAITDIEVEQALLIISDIGGGERKEIPMKVTDGRQIAGRLSVLRDGRYRFGIVDTDGDRLEEGSAHSIRAVLDASPQVFMDEPAKDVELKDDQSVDILWRARDDFGISEVNLVVEPAGDKEPIKVQLSQDDTLKRAEGRYRWSVVELGLDPGTEARFYVEAWDNDAVGGPNHATSAMRRLVLFSARRNHEEILERQRQFLDKMVDWLGAELIAPFPASPAPNAVEPALTKQRALLDQIGETANGLVALIGDIRQDKLSKPEIVTAFENVLTHINTARQKRSLYITRAARRSALSSSYADLSRIQGEAVVQLEKDIIYLDDLLAVQRIDELKETARDLLSAQRELHELLEQYKATQDPALKAALEQRIRDLRQQMLDLLSKMASIKKRLPGEYRNLESASMLQLDDQLGRLEKMLKEGDLESAARELEQLANMIENMVDSINSAEERYGGERYAEIRKELADFAKEFEQLQQQQEALAHRAEDLLKEYRKRAIERAGRNLDNFVEKAREKTAEALAELDEVAHTPGLFGQTAKDMEEARQRLMDLDTLLEHRDFAEAREVGQQAEEKTTALEEDIDNAMSRFGRRSAPELADAMDATQRSLDNTRDVNKMLDKLFPNPKDVLGPEQVAQMQRMGRKQQALQQRAEKLGEKMEQLSGELPLFGGDPRASLDQAGEEMGEAVHQMGRGELPGATGHKRRAAEHLGKLREALEQASQGSQGGLPLPLGMGGGQGRSGGTRGSRQEDVEIPKEVGKAVPQFRKELLEAAKQKAPENYEEAVRRYYEELIR